MSDYRQQRLAEALRREDEALDAMHRDETWKSRVRWMDAVRDRELAMYLAHDCYGPYSQCISCGCSKGKPCVSHQGSPKHQAELLERIAAAAETNQVRLVEPADLGHTKNVGPFS